MTTATHRVTLKGYSGVHLREGEVLRIEADDASTGPIQLVTYQSEYRAGLPLPACSRRLPHHDRGRRSLDGHRPGGDRSGA